MNTEIILEFFKNPNVVSLIGLSIYAVVNLVINWWNRVAAKKKLADSSDAVTSQLALMTESFEISLKKVTDRLDKMELRIEVLDETLEHNSAIPSFAVMITGFRDLTFETFTFPDTTMQTISEQIIDKIINIFIGVMERGFTKYDKATLKQNFARYERDLGQYMDILDTHVVKKGNILQIIQSEESKFFIHMVSVRNKKNGDRQDAFEKLCRKTIISIVEELSELN